ncbi:MAG: thiamine pyrophosphate-binding protein, partial [Steroidobacteraceae bacterium]
MSSNGAQLIIRLLEERGVDLVAGMPGGAVLPLYEALDGSRIRHVLARHEQAAGFIAQGIARIRGRAGVCFVTSGPGVTNVLTALADARLDSVPLVCIAGQVPMHLIGTDAFQEVDATRMAGPVTKARYFVDSAARIPAILAEAFDTAEHGRPGPVLIDIPKNVQCERMEEAAPPAAARAAAPAAATPAAAASTAARSQGYDRAAALIGASERPLLYLGGGVIRARAQRLAFQLAEQAGIAAVTSLMGLGILPHGHALSLGMLGMHGARYTNLAVEASDLLIAIGARFDDRATGNPRTFASGARVIHIDIDPRELGKLRAPDLAIQDDAAAALRELLQRVDLLTPRGERRHTCRRAWHARLQHLKSTHPLARPRSNQLCSPYGIMAALGERLPADAIITTDVGQHQMWAAQALPLQPSHRWLTSGGLGTMGFGLPAAIGAALAGEGAKVVCITGVGLLL